jgi:hypothetical protein
MHEYRVAHINGSQGRAVSIEINAQARVGCDFVGVKWSGYIRVLGDVYECEN